MIKGGLCAPELLLSLSPFASDSSSGPQHYIRILCRTGGFISLVIRYVLDRRREEMIQVSLSRLWVLWWHMVGGTSYTTCRGDVTVGSAVCPSDKRALKCFIHPFLLSVGGDSNLFKHLQCQISWTFVQKETKQMKEALQGNMRAPGVKS